MSFFVTSATSATGNLGGLQGADATCLRLAQAVGQGSRTWRAYLSAERDSTNNNLPAHARDRIGAGPWYNANLARVANNAAELHARTGDGNIFIDERGTRINGQWTGSPGPVQHDILTGSTADGNLAPGLTCADWTSNSANLSANVGHSDGMGPGQSTAGTLSSWNNAHTMFQVPRSRWRCDRGAGTRIRLLSCKSMQSDLRAVLDLSLNDGIRAERSSARGPRESARVRPLDARPGCG